MLRSSGDQWDNCRKWNSEGKRERVKRTVCVCLPRTKQYLLHEVVIELCRSVFERVGGIDGGSDRGSSVTKLQDGLENLRKAYSHEYYNTHKNNQIYRSIVTRR